MWIWAVIIIIAVWWIIKRSQKSNSSQREEDVLIPESNLIEEDLVFKVQGEFEKNLGDTFLPDAVKYRDLYIYKYMMRGWFSELSGKYRYDESMIQKLRKDWLDYMEALRDKGLYNFLSLEAETEEQRESYGEKHFMASSKVSAIQDAFAVAIGEEAVKKLSNLQEEELFAFTREGELASEEESEE